MNVCPPPSDNHPGVHVPANDWNGLWGASVNDHGQPEPRVDSAAAVVKGTGSMTVHLVPLPPFFLLPRLRHRGPSALTCHSSVVAAALQRGRVRMNKKRCGRHRRRKKEYIVYISNEQSDADDQQQLSISACTAEHREARPQTAVKGQLYTPAIYIYIHRIYTHTYTP